MDTLVKKIVAFVVALFAATTLSAQTTYPPPSVGFSGGSVSNPFLAPNGTAAAPGYGFTGNSNTGMYNIAGTGVAFSVVGSAKFGFFSGQLLVGSGGYIGWSSNVDPTAAAGDTGFARSAAGVVQVQGTSGTRGRIEVSDGTIGTNCAIGFTNGFCISASATPAIDFGTTAAGYAQFAAASMLLPSGSRVAWSSGAIRAAGPDTSMDRVAAGVVKAGDGAGGNAWVQNAVSSYLAADYTNATASFTNTNLSVTVKTGRKYVFTLVLHLADSTAADGVAIDFSAGSATSTNLRIGCTLSNDTGGAVTQANAVSTAFGTVINATAMTTVNQHLYVCEGAFEPASNGSFQMRARQNTHSTGTLTIFRGSTMTFDDLP